MLQVEMTLSTGVSTTGAAGDIRIRPHDSNSVDAPGGNIHISGGTNKGVKVVW